MEFNYFLPTKVISGIGCVGKNTTEFSKYGKKAMVVTGGNSGRRSGALEDVLRVFDACGIDYLVYDTVENNPTLDRVKDGGQKAAAFGAGLIIGIGGGSPLDAAKAIAILAVNDIDPLELYKGIYEHKPLPIIAIPTTAGTGSEVTPYSILTRRDISFKKSFGSEDIFPKAAFLDPCYTMSQSGEVTVNTAVDALSHAIEGYIGKKSTPVTDLYAREAIGIFGKNAGALLGKPDLETRAQLQYMSMLGGAVIAHTGTTLVHPMGYALTYNLDIPHGRANGYFMKEYLEFNYAASRGKIDIILELLKLDSIGSFGILMDGLIGKCPVISESDLQSYARTAFAQKSVQSNPRMVSLEDVINIMSKSF